MNTIDFSLNGQRCQATKCETGVIITFIDKIVTDPRNCECMIHDICLFDEFSKGNFDALKSN